MRQLRLAAVLLLLAPSLYAAGAVRVVSRGIDLPSCDGGVKARQLCPGAACKTLSFPFVNLTQSRGDLDLSAGRWELTVQSSRCWAPVVAVDAGASATLPVWPASTIRGTIEPAMGDVLAPLHAEIRLTGAGDEHDALRFVEDCPVANGRWSCRLPAAAFHLRLSLDHNAPRYFRHVSTTIGEEKDFGAIRFEPGASVAGTIVIPCGRHEETVVELTSESAVSSSPVHGTEHRRIVVKESGGGLFQFTGVPKGVYRLIASRRGWLPAEVKTITVENGRESFLESPLRLTRAAIVDVFITPALSSEGEPWLVRLESGAAIAPNKPVAESAASFSGEWRNDALHAGKYVLSVVDRQGSTFLRETVEASADSAPRFLNIHKIHVRGTVKVGSAPFESSLVFTDDEGSSKVTFKANGAGKFEGILSHEGRWEVQVLNPATTFYVKDVAVDVKRTSEQAVATVVVALPGGKAIGRVTNEAGEPAECDVIVFRDGRGIADALVLPDGSFEVKGLDPGPVTLQAVAHGAESDVVSYSAVEDDPARAQLVLRKLVDLKCQLLTEDGYPIAGAVIRYTGAGMVRPRQTYSAPTGEFSLRVPGGTGSLLAAIVAPGFPASLRQLDANSTDTQRIIVATASASLHVVQHPGAPWPFVTLDGQSFLGVTSLMALATAEGLPGLVADGIQVEVAPGVYTICYGGKGEGACQSAVVAVGREQTFFPGEVPAK
jgi:hypothetical protein